MPKPDLKALKKLNPLLVAVNAIFAVYFAALVWDGTPEALPAQAAAIENVAPPRLETGRLGEDGFDYAARQPVFHADRAPAEPPPPVVEEVEPKAVALEVTGIVKTTKNQAWAFLKPKDGTETTEVKVGDHLAGWRVEAIETRTVVLSTGSKTTILYVVPPIDPTASDIASNTAGGGEKPRTRRRE